MFGNSKKPANKGTQSSHASAPVNAGPAAEGELILESLFVDEKPATRTSKFEALAEEADFIDVTPAKAKPADKAKSAEKAKTARKSVFGDLFSKAPRAVAPAAAETVVDAPAVKPAEPIEPAKPAATKPQKPARAPKPPKAPKAPKPAKKPRAPRFAKRSQEHFLLAQISGDRELYFRLSAAGIETVDAIPEQASAISFSREDQRFEVAGKLSHGQAESLVLQEIGDAIQVINRSKDLGAVYATLRARVDAASYRLGPGPLLIDLLSKERAAGAPALVIGLELKDLAGRDALLALYYLSAAGRLSEPQISVYPDNREFLLNQFAATHQAARENAQVLMLDHAALLEAAASIAYYPNEPLIGGIPARQVWSKAAIVGVLAALATGAWAQQSWVQHERLRHEVASLQGQVQQMQNANNEILGGAPRTLARGLTLDVPALLTRSQAVWVPGSRVQLSADGSGADYTVTLPLLKTGPGGRPAAAAAFKSDAVESLMALSIPEGCQRGALNFSGTFNEAQLSIRCEATPRPLDRYRDR